MGSRYARLVRKFVGDARLMDPLAIPGPLLLTLLLARARRISCPSLTRERSLDRFGVHTHGRQFGL